MTAIRSIRAELLKLSYAPIRWLTGFIVLATLLLVFTGYYLDVHNAVSFGSNPWTRLSKSIEAVYSIFIGVPFVVLITSAALNVEHQNHGFKQLYALPQNRAVLILYKLAALLCILGLATLFLVFGNVLIGYLLNAIYPESEFAYYTLPAAKMIKAHAYIFVSSLGVIGIQFFLSLRFRGFLVPASIGIFSYVIGLILTTTSTNLSLYFPYSYPIIARTKKMFDTSFLEVDQFAFLNSVELSSIGIFVCFVLLSVVLEKNRNI